MSPTRRDILNLAAGLGLTAATPTSAERVAVMARLDQPVSTNPLLDPGTFATDTESLIGQLHDEWWSAINPEMHAAYRQAEQVFEDMLPWMKDNEQVWRAWGNLSDATSNLVTVAYTKGIEHGAHYEHLRRSIIGETTGCRTCWGVGTVASGATCSKCGGSGTVLMGGAK